MKTYLIIGLSFYLLLACNPAHAKVYKWVDEKGKMHFTNDPSQIPKTKNTKVKTLREALPPIRNQTSPQQESDISTEAPIKGLEGISRSKESDNKDKPGIERSEKSYKKLLQLAEESRERKLDKIKELQELDYKPESWTADESLEETIEGIKKSVEKSDEEIRRYKEKVNPSATD